MHTENGANSRGICTFDETLHIGVAAVACQQRCDYQNQNKRRKEDAPVGHKRAHCMTFLRKLFAGRVSLWITFWLIGIPLAAVWDVSGGCIFAECGISSLGPLLNLFFARLLMALFALSNVGVAFISVAIWRSASRHRRAVWLETLLAFSAKVYAVLTGVTAFAVLIAIVYGILHYTVTWHV